MGRAARACPPTGPRRLSLQLRVALGPRPGTRWRGVQSFRWCASIFGLWMHRTPPILLAIVALLLAGSGGQATPTKHHGQESKVVLQPEGIPEHSRGPGPAP